MVRDRCWWNICRIILAKGLTEVDGERDIENSIGYGYRMRKIIEHAKISLRQKAVEYYGWSYIRSMFA